MHYLDIELMGIDEKGEEKNFKLSDFKGENIILYFYPMDDTPVCTKEAHEFKDIEGKLKKAILDHQKNMQNIQRSTFILDKDGNIIKYWEKVDVDGHTDEIFEYIKEQEKHH